jgi:hypothetical protein
MAVHLKADIEKPDISFLKGLMVCLVAATLLCGAGLGYGILGVEDDMSPIAVAGGPQQ